MYLPLDPNKTEGLWERFSQSLAQGAPSPIVSNGERVLLDSLYDDDPRLVIERFRDCGYSRIGTSRSVAVPAHFGVRVDGDVGYLQEYLAHDNHRDQILSDLRKLSQLIFYEIPTLRKLIIPFEITGLACQGVICETKSGFTEVSLAI